MHTLQEVIQHTGTNIFHMGNQRRHPLIQSEIQCIARDEKAERGI